MGDVSFIPKRGKQHMQHMKQISTTLGALALAGAFACSGDSTGVSANGAGSIGFMASSSAAAAMVPVTNGGHTLDLTAVALTISRAELKRSHSDNCPGDDDQDDDHPSNIASTESCGELKIGPTTIDLPLTGNVVTIPANTIPAGTFREFELRVSKVELKGTFDGKAFDDTIAVDLKQEVEFDTPLVVTADTPVNVTVSVPANTWLVNSDGTLVDPATLATNSSVLARVKARIAASFRAFEDHDHDGREDHGGHGHD